VRSISNTNPHYDPDAVTNPANPHFGDPDYTEKVLFEMLLSAASIPGRLL